MATAKGFDSEALLNGTVDDPYLYPWDEEWVTWPSIAATQDFDGGDVECNATSSSTKAPVPMKEKIKAGPEPKEDEKVSQSGLVKKHDKISIASGGQSRRQNLPDLSYGER